MERLKMAALWLAGAAVLAIAAFPMITAPASGPVVAAAPAPAMETTLAAAEPQAAAAIAPDISAAPVSNKAITATPEDTAPTGKALGSGEAGSKCLLKTFEPIILKTHDWKKHVAFSQSKLICTDTVGTSETIIEQNDQLVIADTIVNNQTSVTLHNLTVQPNDEQWKDAFCQGVARQGTGGFGVVAQECAPLSDFAGKQHHRKGGGMMFPAP